MNLAATLYFRFAQEAERLMNEERDELKKKEYRKVAGQNYFYATIEALEGVLCRAGVDLYSINSHQERLRVLKLHSKQFKNPQEVILKLEILINYDYRRKVAYKGENGNKFLVLKELAVLCQLEIE